MTKGLESPHVTGILVAAGNGKRMLGISKQLYPLEGLPVIAYTIKAFLACPEIKELVLVCRNEEQGIVEKLASEHIKNLDYIVVCGADTRQDSVFCGVNAASAATDYYAIHDGVRPLIKPEEISACVKKAVRFGAAALGVRVKDTIKVVNSADVIVSTPERESLYAIQTPQIFEANLYRRAIQAAVAEKKNYTDDCQLIEHIGHSVIVCEGSYENIKITTRDDIYLAKAILDYRRNSL